MALKIKQQLAPHRRYYAGTNPVTGITIHTTGNKNAGADAQAHANLQSRGNVRVASWQWQVDDKEAIQSYEDKRQCWHAGDGRGPGNTTTTAIEICVNSDGNYTQAVTNAAELTAMLMRKHGIKSTAKVRQHNEFSTFGKNCPREIRDGKAGIDWPAFLAMVQSFYDGGAPEPIDPPQPPYPTVDEDGWWGTDFTTALQDAFGTPVDGEVWRQPSAANSPNPGLTWGWKFNGKAGDGGSPLIHALWKFLRGKGISTKTLGSDDGKIGVKHIKGLQVWLTSIGYYHGLVDGKLDGPSSTIKAFQRAVNNGLVN